jgi:hypothetical protein
MGLPFWRFSHLLRLNIILLILCSQLEQLGTMVCPRLWGRTLSLIGFRLTGVAGAMMNALHIAPYWKKYFHHPAKAQLGLINAIFPGREDLWTRDGHANRRMVWETNCAPHCFHNLYLWFSYTSCFHQHGNACILEMVSWYPQTRVLLF